MQALEKRISSLEAGAGITPPSAAAAPDGGSSSAAKSDEIAGIVARLKVIESELREHDHGLDVLAQVAEGASNDSQDCMVRVAELETTLKAALPNLALPDHTGVNATGSDGASTSKAASHPPALTQSVSFASEADLHAAAESAVAKAKAILERRLSGIEAALQLVVSRGPTRAPSETSVAMHAPPLAEAGNGGGSSSSSISAGGSARGLEAAAAAALDGGDAVGAVRALEKLMDKERVVVSAALGAVGKNLTKLERDVTTLNDRIGEAEEALEKLRANGVLPA